jgi:thiamine biosynthesis protein ThiS
MELIINGQPKDFGEGLTLAVLVEQFGMKADRVAIELNGEIIRRDDWAGKTLCAGDRLEIVHFVGGGSRGKSRPAVVNPDGAGITMET